MHLMVGYRGRGGAGWLDAMLRAVDGAGEVRRLEGPHGALAVRGGWVDGASAAFCARLGAPGADAWVRVEGDGDTLRFEVDPLGGATVFYATVDGGVVWATSLDAVLAAPGLSRDVDVSAVQSLMMLSLVPDGATLVAGVRRMAPGSTAVLDHHGFRAGQAPEPRWRVRADVDLAAAAREVDAVGLGEVASRAAGVGPVGLFLSGGLDSAAVAVWLRRLGVPTLAFTLDLGQDDVEVEVAEHIGRRLGIPVRRVPLRGRDVRDLVAPLIAALDVPSLDAAAVGQLALCRAARAAGLRVVFNGEGGDQLFGGWSTRPLVAAAAVGEDEVGATLRTFHRFAGSEAWLFQAPLAGGAGSAREVVAGLLAGADDLVSRARRLDLLLRARWALAPRAARIGASAGLDVRMPLLGASMIDLGMSLPPGLKLTGAVQKAALREALRPWLPSAVLDRPKTGMSLPVTRWVDTSLLGLVHDKLGADAVRRRGLLRPDGVAAVLREEDNPGEARRRRRGEKVWALLLLEAWLRARRVAPLG